MYPLYIIVRSSVASKALPQEKWGSATHSSITLVVNPYTLKTNVYIGLVIQTVALPFKNIFQGVFSNKITRPLIPCCIPTCFMEYVALVCRSPDLSLIEHEWDIIRYQRQRHP
ncbi:hypothetical protein TNCV_4339841 [Trichonephila clavipes]|nr:hypothetical protein TNCV_4339841 [Trichonephila clavipes]